MAVSSISLSRTPQAGDDTFLWTEDEASAHLVGTNILSLDVMINDLGGNARKLYSIDDGNGNALASDSQLLARDVGVNGNPAGVSAWEATDDGNLIRINNGKIEFDLSRLSVRLTSIPWRQAT